MKWQFRSYEELDKNELLALLKLRVDVFVVEQTCAYPEIDQHDNDSDTVHVLGLEDQLVAYCRAMPNDKLKEVRIGRVVVDPAHRGRGLAREMMLALMNELSGLKYDYVLSAQTSVLDFYQSLDFVPQSKEYVEDGIPHVDMRRLRELP